MAAKPGARWGDLRGEQTALQRLAVRLRQLADQHGRSLRDLSQVMPYGRTAISERLNGASRPEWEFVTAFIHGCVRYDAQAADLLMREIRPLWDAAGSVQAIQLPERGDTDTTELTELIGSMHALAVSQRQAADAQLAVTTNIKHLAGLTTLLDYLAGNIQHLTEERDLLLRRVNEQQRLDAELDLTRRELAATQARLDGAEAARMQAERLLEEALRQRAEALRLKDAALARLADTLERHGERVTRRPPPANGPVLRFDADHDEVSEVLRQASEALRKQAGDLNRLSAELPSASRPLSVLSAGQPPDRGGPAIWGRIPPRNPHFADRSELFDQIRQTFERPSRPVCLHGLGGVGKSQLAAEYVFRHRGDYDLIWWVPADQAVLARSVIAALARDLSLPSSTTIGTHEAAQAVIHALASGAPYARWLLIFDNADQVEDISPFIPNGPGHVLITTRNHRWSTEAWMIAVGVFARQESIEYLVNRLQDAIDPADAAELAEELGDLPLAVTQAAALLSATGMSIAEYLAELRARVDDLRTGQEPHEYPISMLAAWAISIKALGHKHPDATELLHLCAVLGPEPIPRDLFATTLTGLGDTTSDFIGDPVRLSLALSAAHRFALAHVDLPARTIQIHRLIRALLRRELDTTTAQRIQHDVRMLMAEFAAGDPSDPASWPRYGSLVGHVYPLALDESTCSKIRQLALRVVHYLYASANFHDAQRFVQTFLRAWTDDPGQGHPDVLEACYRQAAILRDLGDYRQAAAVTRRALASARQLPADNGYMDEPTLRLLRGHAADLRVAGDFQQALRQSQENHQRFRQQYGDDLATLEVLTDLATDLALTCRYQDAKQTYETILRSSVIGERPASAVRLRALGGLARVLRLCGDYSAACEVGEDAHALGSEELGVDHLWTLRIARDLSVAYRRLADPRRALSLAEEIHARHQRLFNASHPDSLAATISLANALRTIRRPDAALDLMQGVVTRYPDTHGTDHPYYFGCLTDLAILLRITGEPEQALQLNQKAFTGLEKIHGIANHHTLTVMINLASDHAAQGDPETACQLGRQSADRLTTLFGTDHPLTLCASSNLISDLRTTGDHTAAEALHTRVQHAYTLTLGSDHPDAVQMANGQRIDCDFDPMPT